MKTPATPRPRSAPRAPGRRAGPKALYDGVTGSGQTTGGGNKRRQATIEIGHEEDRILRPLDRLRATGLLRDALRNFAVHRSMIRQQRINVVGSLGKLIVLAEPDGWGKKAQTWFNSAWAPQAEFRAGQSWGELLQLVIAEVSNNGDCVLAFDDGTITGGQGSGRILSFETDQIANLPQHQFAQKFPKAWTQVAGVIRDEWGREVGIIVSNDRGSTELEAERALILRKDPLARRADCWWTFVKRQYRLVQIRGVGDGLTAVPLTCDNYEMMAKELQSAKRNASIAALVKRGAPDVNLDDQRLDPSQTQPADPATPDATANGDALPEKLEPSNYDRLESLTGGLTEYLDPDDNVEFPDMGRPNVNMPAFIDFGTDMAGAAFGLAHAYARLRADTSYTAFRGDMVLTWVSMLDNQKFLERTAADWGATQAIRWAIATGQLPPPPEAIAATWPQALAWQWPRMPEVNEVDAQAALEKKLKNGATTFAEILGPAWRERFEQLAVEVAEARRLDLPLSIFESKAGAIDGAQPKQKPDGDKGS